MFVLAQSSIIPIESRKRSIALSANTQTHTLTQQQWQFTHIKYFDYIFFESFKDAFAICGIQSYICCRQEKK